MDRGRRASLVHAERQDRRVPSGRDDPRGRRAARRRDSAPLLHGRHAAGRQLPHLHGRDQGRARARAVLLPLSQGRDGGHHQQRAGGDQPEDVARAAARRTFPRQPTRSTPSSICGRGSCPSASRASPRAISRPRISRIRRWRCTSTPASSASAACAPAAKSRSTTSSATPSAAATRRSCSTSTIRWATPPASPAANACRRVPTGALMPARDVGKIVADKQVDSVCPYCGVGCQLTYTSRTTRSSTCRARTAPRTRAACASRAATASTTCSTSIA